MIGPEGVATIARPSPLASEKRDGVRRSRQASGSLHPGFCFLFLCKGIHHFVSAALDNLLQMWSHSRIRFKVFTGPNDNMRVCIAQNSSCPYNCYPENIGSHVHDSGLQLHESRNQQSANNSCG